MLDIGSEIVTAFDTAWDRFMERLDGMDDPEYFWEPVPGGWSVRQDDDGEWRIDADGGGGPAPDPVPFTSIAWRIGHIGMTFISFGDRLFADGRVTIDDIDIPGSAMEAMAFLEGHYRGWIGGIGTFDAERWAEPVGPAFGPYAEHTTANLVLHVLDEITHHAAEVAILRDLYPHRHHLQG